MLESLRHFIAELTSADSHERAFAEDDYRLAAAGLFIHLISIDERGRARIVEMMWELVYADGRVSEFEESVVWRAADLLGISSTERVALKRRVAGTRLAPDAAG